MKRKKQKKRIILLAVFLLIAATWGMRVYWLNQKYPDVERKTYDLQEEVELGKDIIDYDTMEGYFVTIESADIYEYEDLLSQYDLEDFMERDAPERIYLLKVRLRNTDNTETGIDVLSWKIQSNSVSQSLDFELYYELNQLDTYSVALREDSEKEFLLPYNLRKDFFYPSEWENLEDYEMWLTVTWYPTKKMLLLI